MEHFDEWLFDISDNMHFPDEEADGYGVHVPIAESGDSKCHCYRLYNEQKEFGCMWFALWKLKTDVAIRNGCRLIVVTKKRGDVGYSQKGEIEYLKEKDVAFTSISIYQFAFHHLKSALDMVLETDTFELRQVMHMLSPCQRQKLMDVLSEDGQDASLESARECPEPSDIGLQSATAQDIHAGVQSLPPELRQKLFQAIALLERHQMPQAPQPPGKQAQEKLILEENFRNTGQSRQLEKREKREKLDELEELENDERRAPTAPSSSTQHYATVRRKRPVKLHGPEAQPECVIH